MPAFNPASLTPPRLADLRRKLEAAGCRPPPQACTLGELSEAIVEFRRRQGIAGRGVLDAQTLRRLDEVSGATFGDIFRDELDLLRPQPENHAGADEPSLRAHQAGLVGLALSGGGVRSATFGLGVLQAMAGHKLLRHLDYLSTVSGGGFIGGWLSKCIHEQGGDVEKVEGLLAPPAGGAEAPAIRFLRQYSNYLSPRGGMFSADTWTLIGTYVRNTGLNLTMLVAWLCALLLLPRVCVWAVHRIVGPGGPWAAYADLAWMFGILLFLAAVFCIALSISSKPSGSRGLRRFPLSQGAVLWWINLPLLLAGFLGSVGLWRHGGMAPFWELGGLPAELQGRAHWLLAPGFVYFVVWACGWYMAHDRISVYRRAGYTLCTAALVAVLAVLCASVRAFAPEMMVQLMSRESAEHIVNGLLSLSAVLVLCAIALAVMHRLQPHRPPADVSRLEVLEGLSHLLCAVGALTLGAVLLLGGLALLPDPSTHPVLNNAIALTTFGMPLMMALFAGTMTLMIGLIGRMYSDASREWWSRQGAWTWIFALAWVTMFGVAFFLSPLLHWAWLTFEPWSTISTFASWLFVTWFGLKAGSSSATGSRTADWRLDLCARLAPYVFTAGVFALLGAFVQWVVAPPRLACPAPVTLTCVYGLHASATLETSGARLATAFAGFTVAALLLGWRVDINKFSLYMMYRNRLVRAYFGASNRARKPHPFTGFDPGDDPLLADLKQQRPCHIINTSLNLVGGEELAWRTRKAASFTFTPRHCGFELPPQSAGSEAARGCYRATSDYGSRSGTGADDDAGVRLGMAIAVSGAAASPNMGAHSSPPLNFLMTMFNVRLGRWCPNPRRQAWQQSSPPVGLFSLLAELFGLTNADASYVYLSDGGHFDNLGIYELVRRRCRLIVAVDGASDGLLSFEDLGNAIRKCATDLHVRIDLDVGKLAQRGGEGLCGASCAVGTVRYSQVDAGGVDGTLLYLKPAIVGRENADLLNYRKVHPAYPHESSVDQWFDETQFESYRALGQYIADCALGQAAGAMQAREGGFDVDALCAELWRRHGPREPGQETPPCPEVRESCR
ncbi:MAG: patatin-like phospholipase family protein [Pseudomonadota bacterium]